MKSLVSLPLLLPLLATASPVIGVDSIHANAAPLLSSTHSEEIPDSYIVVFKDHIKHEDAVAHHTWVQDIHDVSISKRSQHPLVDKTYEGLRHGFNIANSLLGYTGHFDDQVLETIRRHPDVDFVEKDSLVHTMDSFEPQEDEGETEKNAPWGLARISHRHTLSFGTFNKYLYAEDGGEGVDVYVIDTGTNVKHIDFEGRASWGKTIPEGDADEDGNGHGTHCSGTIAGKKYGVAKKAHVKAVKVLRSSGSGTMSDVIRGVEYAADAHIEEVKKAKKGKRKGFKGSTANMSLGGGKSPALDRAVDAAVEIGIHFAVAAGNDNADACNYSPAAAKKAVTVGASDLSDTRAYFSNYGPCTDIFGPGVNILSTWIGGNNTINTISGTSMASPHIAGLLAYLLSLQPAKDSEYAVAEISPKELKAELIGIGTEGALSDIPPDTINILAWNGGGSSNFTEIVNRGGYSIKSKSNTHAEQNEVTLEQIEEDMEAIQAKLKDFFHSVVEEVEDMGDELAHVTHKGTEKLEDFMAEELRGF